jgi:transcriptional regulator with AAA-type ATPase domain
VDATYPDPYLALGYDSMLVLTSCLNDMSTGKNLGGSPGPIDGHRIALRSCLAAGVDTASLSLVTGLKGFDKSGEALRDLAQTTYILRVGAQNTLVPAASDDAGIQVLSSPWWQPSFMRLLWSLFGAVVAIAAYSLMIRRRQPVVSGKLATPEIETPQIIDTRPAKAVTGESCWFAGEFFFGTDAASQQALQVVRKACVDNTDKKPVILMGPPGVGKTQLAQLIHKSSLRGKSGKPFLVIDCATITESLFDSELAGAARGAFTGAVADRKGLLESADGGTVLFDEIAEIRPELQARILRFLQNNEVRPVGSTNARKLDVRIIAATNKDLAAFRPDLWGRLSQGNLVINIPSLDSHWWDIPEYIDGFLQRLGNGACISDQSLEILSACSWRNNFRGLGCLNESGVAMGLVGGVASSLAGGIITPQSLLASVGSEPDVQAQMARAIENLGMTPPPNEHPGALFPDGMDKWFAKTEPRRAWELVLDAAFNRFRGPQNENFLLPSRESKRLALSLEELATVVGLPDGSAAVKSLRDAGVLVLPKILREKELSQSVSLLHRRQLILFAKRTNFIRLSHEELAEVCGVNRTKYYNFYHYAHALAEEFYKDGVVPPMSRYVIDHKGEAERSDRRAAFANDAFEKRVGVTTESFAILRKLPLLPGRSRVQA